MLIEVYASEMKFVCGVRFISSNKICNSYSAHSENAELAFLRCRILVLSSVKLFSIINELVLKSPTPNI